MKIAVIGYSCSGKTTLSHQLAQDYPGHRVIHTDEYQEYGFDQAMYAVMKDILANPKDFIVEGIHTYRLLRKGVETGKLDFDCIIHCKTAPDERSHRYATQRQPGKEKYLPAFDKSLDKIFADYLTMCSKRNKTPVIYDYET
jgi:2-phosphoglycerate kinase